LNQEYVDSIVSTRYLRDNPDHIFVFGDNKIGRGKKGAAIHRDEPNAYGFVTKKYPNYKNESYYKPREYKDVFEKEMSKLMQRIEENPQQTFLISRLGSGLANKYRIWEKVICEGLETLKKYPNVKFLYKKEGE
jgi:hypothetical protein